MKVKTKKNAIPGAWIVDPKDRGRRPIKKGNVYLKNGEEFEIEIFNPLKTNILADIRINGDSISEGGLIIKPGQREYLDCFINDGRKFKFETYTVENSEEAKEAISENGMMEIFFYKEDVLRFSNWRNRINTIQPIIIRDRNWYTYQSIPLVPNIWCGNHYSNTGGYSGTLTTTFVSPQSYVAPTNVDASVSSYSAQLSNDIETGRVEMGEKSKQTFHEVDMDFEELQIHSIIYNLLPESQQPTEVKKIKKTNNNDGVLTLLTELADMNKKGILTEKEFTDKKKELLSRI